MKKDAGFTLIEVIAVLVLVGILSVLAGFGIVRGVEGYLFAQNNTETTQKAQLALARMTSDISELSSINSTSSGTAIIFSTPSESRKIGLDVTYIKWASGATALASGDILTDGVNSFAITYCDTSNVCANTPSSAVISDPKQLARIDLRLRLTRPDVSPGYLEFTTSIVPRNTGVKNAPTG